MLLEIWGLVREVLHPAEIVIGVGLFIWAIVGVYRMFADSNSL